MTAEVPEAALAVLLLAISGALFAAQIADARSVAGNEIQFRADDDQAQAIARRLSQENRGDLDVPFEDDRLLTAWAKTSDGGRPALFVMHDCSPTGNCQLNGFEGGRHRYRLVLDSLAQRVWVLRSSHAGHRDLSAYMHGDAFEGTRKIYWWRGGRYMRVSERAARSGD